MSEACNTTGSATVGAITAHSDMKTLIDVTPRAVEKLKAFMQSENKV